MRIERRYTTEGQDAYAGIAFRLTTSEIRNPDGSVVFKLDNVEVPEFWSQVASDVLAQKYFRKAGVPVRLKKVEETSLPSFLWRSVADTEALAELPKAERFGSEISARQVFDRLAGAWAYWGWKGGYFDTEEDAQAFSDELRYMLAKQMVAPNSPQWFNTGLHWAYGIDGPGQGHYYVDWKTGKLTKSKSAYEHPQPHACFIQGIEDDLVNEGGIMDLWVREARLFKYGSGTGSNFSRLRGEGERLSGGGRSSGLMSFLKIGDRAAGAIKSGGTTRRAAKMVIVDADQLAREVVAPGEPAYLAIVGEFGDGVLNSDRTLDRRALGKIVFADPTARHRLERITHPAIESPADLRLIRRDRIYKHVGATGRAKWFEEAQFPVDAFAIVDGDDFLLTDTHVFNFAVPFHDGSYCAICTQILALHIYIHF